ncbi:MAG: cysteine hydrolase family protein [Gaiellaceae bacterium]
MITIHGKDVPTEVHELVDPASSALLIIDMQNDCCSEGGSGHRAGSDLSMYREIVPRIAGFAEACRLAEVPVIHVRILTLPDGASDSPAWIRLRLRANANLDPSNDGAWEFTLEGSWGAEFVPELQPQAGEPVVTKFRSSAFRETNLDLLLRSNGITNVMVAGCTTEGCVESTVRDLCFYDYFGIVLGDCVGSDVRALHDASMLVMGAYRADIATSSEVVEAWKQLGALPKATKEVLS